MRDTLEDKSYPQCGEAKSSDLLFLFFPDSLHYALHQTFRSRELGCELFVVGQQPQTIDSLVQLLPSIFRSQQGECQPTVKK